MVLPKMVEKRKGAVVNIGSASCFGFPLLTVYAATKAYVDSFSKNLDAEYSDKGRTHVMLGIKKEISLYLNENHPPELLAGYNGGSAL